MATCMATICDQKERELEKMQKLDEGQYLSDADAYMDLRSFDSQQVRMEMEVRDCPENCAKTGIVVQQLLKKNLLPFQDNFKKCNTVCQQTEHEVQTYSCMSDCAMDGIKILEKLDGFITDQCMLNVDKICQF